jgi:hypothetical protein
VLGIEYNSRKALHGSVEAVVQADRTIANNKPDITMPVGKGTCVCYNVIKNEAKKILKYKDLVIDIQYMWNVKAKVSLVTIGATGSILKSLKQYFSSILRKHKIKELQKTATTHVLWKVLM